MATLLYPGKEFKITHMEMIKGIRRGSNGTNYRYYQILEIDTNIFKDMMMN